jgi:hypothetical protein
MSQPVNLSDPVLYAQLAGEAMERSVAGQVECVRPLSECLESVDSSAGQRRVASFLETQPFPHYQAHLRGRGLFIRIDADGKRTVGRFVNREFRPAKPKSKRR